MPGTTQRLSERWLLWWWCCFSASCCSHSQATGRKVAGPARDQTDPVPPIDLQREEGQVERELREPERGERMKEARGGRRRRLWEGGRDRRTRGGQTHAAQTGEPQGGTHLGEQVVRVAQAAAFFIEGDKVASPPTAQWGPGEHHLRGGRPEG